MPAPPPWEPLPDPRPRQWLRWGVPTAIALLLVLGALQLQLPYYAIAPGQARQVNDLIRVPKDRSFPPQGRVLLSTVSLRQVNAIDALRGWLDDDIDVLPEDRVLNNTPRTQFRQENLQQMDDSKQTAVVVALRRLGYSVTERGKGALVVQFDDGSPADGRLAQGDVITGVDGRPVTLYQEVVQAIRAHQPGETVRLDVTAPAGAPRVEEIRLATRPKGAGAGAFLGVSLQTKERKFDFPFDVDIDSGSIGGPSAGLAFTLGIIDELSEGELTGGKRIAATGTIEIDGTVGDVGGVVQKTAAVRAAGAQVFFVPAGEYDDAVSHAGPGLEVVKVSTLDDAIKALSRLGGDASALGGPPPTS